MTVSEIRDELGHLKMSPDGVAPNPKSEHSGSPWSNVSPFWHVLSRLGSQNAPAGA